MSASPKRAIRVLASVGAWIFATGSLFALAMVLYWQFPTPSDTRTQLFGVTVDGVMHSGVAFSYAGVSGTILAALEFLVVLAALVLSTAGGRSLRRAGHGVLLAWCALWLSNAIYLTIVDTSASLRGVTIVLAVLFICTATRAVITWLPGQVGDVDVAA